MGKLKFEEFGGMIPALDDRLLPIGNAAYTENAFLQAGRLEPLAADISIHTLADPAARYAFRVPAGSPDIEQLKDSYWLEFENVNTYVVRSPVVNQQDGGRFYWANGTSPPGYTTKDRIVANAAVPGSAPPLILGIPRPPVAPGVTATGGTGPTETRAYVYTWVSASGEEGQPSPPTVATGNADGTWTITFTPPSVGDTTNRNLTHINLYRTVTGPSGEVDFFFVVQLPIATTTFDDTVSGDVVANSQPLLSSSWGPPPDDLVGMVSMPNGMIAGWRENEIWFCEPYRPHAWPVEYVLGVDAPIVGLGTVDQSCIAVTSGNPYSATGVHPSIMALRKLNPLEPCTSPGSIVSTPIGVLYTSYNGLILIGATGGQNLTFSMIRKDEWMRLLNLSTVQGSYFMNGYYCYSGVADGVFQEDAFQNDAFQMENFFATQVGAFISPDAKLGYMTLKCDAPTYNVMTDVWTGETFVIRSGQVFHVDRREYLPRQSYTWRSKIIQLPYKENYAAAKIFFDAPQGGPPSENTYFRMYADGILKSTRQLSRSGLQFRLPSGYKADFIQFELQGQLMIYNLQVATSARELREV